MRPDLNQSHVVFLKMAVCMFVLCGSTSVRAADLLLKPVGTEYASESLLTTALQAALKELSSPEWSLATLPLRVDTGADAAAVVIQVGGSAAFNPDLSGRVMRQKGGGKRIELNPNMNLDTALREMLRQELGMSAWNAGALARGRADMDRNGALDLKDLALFMESYNQKNKNADINNDTRVDDKDLKLFQMTYQKFF